MFMLTVPAYKLIIDVALPLMIQEILFEVK
jgi:hypothetical protein